MLSDLQKNVLIGSMLGDGHLQLNGRSKNARLIIRRAIKDEDYLLWEKDIFSNYCSDKCIRYYNDYLKKTNKTYQGVCLTSLANAELTYYQQEWYQPYDWYQNIKIVPLDLVLNSMIMLIWFLDDGSIVRNDHEKLILKFATDGFRRSDTLFLKDLLEKRYGGTFKLYKNSIFDDDNFGYRLYGYNKPAEAFVEEMNSIILPCMSRKYTWLEPYEKKIHTYDIKRVKIKEYLQDKDIFYTNDLGRNSGFCFTRSNGRVEVATSNLNIYLKEYIDNSFIVELKRDNYHLGCKYQITDLGKNYIKKEITK